MQTFAERLTSFEVAHPATKKRTSSAKNAKSLRWPHKTPFPAQVSPNTYNGDAVADGQQLAEAGFFFSPSASAPDNAACFLCQTNIDGWEANDNPAVEHLKLSPQCGWAINVCVEQKVETATIEDLNLASDKMLEARKMTFSSRWPHENKRGWLCKSQKVRRYLVPKCQN